MKKISKNLLLLIVAISSFALITSSARAMKNEGEGSQTIDDQTLIPHNRGLPEFVDAVALFADNNENQNVIGKNQANGACRSSLNKFIVKIIKKIRLCQIKCVRTC
jgi:hypothetical protein